MTLCEWCGMYHAKRCPQVKAMNFHRPTVDENGRLGVMLSRIEFNEPPLIGFVKDPESHLRESLAAGVGAFIREVSKVFSNSQFVPGSDVFRALTDNADPIVHEIFKAMVGDDSPNFSEVEEESPEEAYKAPSDREGPPS